MAARESIAVVTSKELEYGRAQSNVLVFRQVDTAGCSAFPDNRNRLCAISKIAEFV